MDHDDDGETSYNTFVDDVAFEPTYLQALLTAAGRNVATVMQQKVYQHWIKDGWWTVRVHPGSTERIVPARCRQRTTQLSSNGAPS